MIYLLRQRCSPRHSWRELIPENHQINVEKLEEDEIRWLGFENADRSLSRFRTKFIGARVTRTENRLQYKYSCCSTKETKRQQSQVNLLCIANCDRTRERDFICWMPFQKTNQPINRTVSERTVCGPKVGNRPKRKFRLAFRLWFWSKIHAFA